MKHSVTKIMVFGTFDMVHPGHLHFFKQARRLAKNPFLIVSIARDKNVKKIKGRKSVNSEKKRARIVGDCELVDKVVLGGVSSYLPHIKKEAPDIIALGYDQKAYVESLQKDLKYGKIGARLVRLKSHKPHKYKTTLLKQRRSDASTRRSKIVRRRI